MKNVLKTFFVSLVLLLILIAPSTALAQTRTTPNTSTGSSNTGGSEKVQEGLTSISGAFPNSAVNTTNPQEFIKKIIDWALYLSAIIAVIFIIIGGYMYITSAGNATKAGTGTATVRNALIGLALVVLSYLIVQIVYNFLVGRT